MLNINKTINASIISASSNGINAVGGVPAVALINGGHIQGNLNGALLQGGAAVFNTGLIEGEFTGLSISANGIGPPSGSLSAVFNAGIIRSNQGFNGVRRSSYK
ncbi:hypothetical protein BH10PSE19_BH10PSE19_05470 [soil metagenome]